MAHVTLICHLMLVLLYTALATHSKDSFRISVSCHSIIELFGVVPEEMPLFCRDFACCRDLLETYVSYCPNTFSYRGLSGGVNEGEMMTPN
jgi:hypothetical protein